MPDSSGPPVGQDRRQYPRLSIAVEVDFRSEHNFYSGRIHDISIGGLFIETNVALPIGTKLTVDLKLMKKDLRADAEVIWALVGDADEPTGVGVRFVDLPGSVKKSIEAFMALRKPIRFDMTGGEEPGD
jgi:uncharacterized protein (TIGR02266 family)